MTFFYRVKRLPQAAELENGGRFSGVRGECVRGEQPETPNPKPRTPSPFLPELQSF